MGKRQGSKKFRELVQFEERIVNSLEADNWVVWRMFGSLFAANDSLALNKAERFYHGCS
jgi:hypothetical protein